MTGTEPSKEEEAEAEVETEAESSLVHSLLRSGSLVFVGLVVEVVLLFLAKVMMARVLGPERFGAVSLGLATFTVTSTLVLLGMNTGISRFMPREDDSSATRGVLVSAIQLTVPLSLAAGGLLVVLAPAMGTAVFHDPTTTPILRVFGLVVPLWVVSRLALGGIRGAKRTLPKVYLKNLLTPATRLIAIGAFLYAGWSGVGVAWAYVVSYGLAVLAGLYYLSRYTPLFERVPYARRHRELLSFSAPLVVSSAMALIFDKLDTLMLGFFWPSSEAGIYNVVYPVAWALLLFLNAFRYLFMPALSELHSEGSYEEMERMYQLTTKWVFLSTLPPFLALVLFPRQVLTFAFGPAYAEGSLTLVVLSVAFFTHAVAGPNRESLTSVGDTRLIMYDNAVVAAVNVVLNLLLIPRFSYVGAAVATACSYALLNVLYSYQLYRRTGIQPLTAGLLRPGVVATGAVLASYWVVTASLGHGPAAIALLVAATVVGYPLVVLRFGQFQPEERSTLRRVRHRLGSVSKAIATLGR